MLKHAGIVRPKFELVLDMFDRELAGLGICEWIKPNGGYFISFDAMEGCAKKIVIRLSRQVLFLPEQAQHSHIKKTLKIRIYVLRLHFLKKTSLRWRLNCS